MEKSGFQKNDSQVLSIIAEKTKKYQDNSTVKQLLYIGGEFFCYGFVICFWIAAFFLPDYLEVQLDFLEDEFIGFYILEPEERALWKLLLRVLLIVLGFFPLGTGMLFRKGRKKNNLLSWVAQKAMGK